MIVRVQLECCSLHGTREATQFPDCVDATPNLLWEVSSACGAALL